MTFRIEINTDNAAFEGEQMGPELARILRRVAETVETISGDDTWQQTVRDINGNTVGAAEIVDD